MNNYFVKDVWKIVLVAKIHYLVIFALQMLLILIKNALKRKSCFANVLCRRKMKF